MTFNANRLSVPCDARESLMIRALSPLQKSPYQSPARRLIMKIFLLLTVTSSVLSLSPLQLQAAPNTKERAKASFKKGKIAFEASRYPEALLAFEEAYQLFPLPLMLYNIANVYERLNLLPQALRQYQAFIKTGKDGNGEAAKRVKVIEERIESWPEVTITTQPAGASIKILSESYPSLGETPVTLRLEPQNEMLIYLKPTEGKLIKRFVQISSTSHRQTIKIDLPKKEAYVRILGSPPNLQAKSGSLKTNGVPALMKLSVGDHEVELSAPGYLPIKRSVSLRSVHTQSAPLALEAKLKTSEGVALVALNVSRPGSLLFIDGLPQGQSPFDEPLELAEGEHLIEVKGPNGENFKEKLSLKAGEMAQLSVNFERRESIFTRDRITVGMMSLGAASLLTGLVLGGIALSAGNDLDDCRAHELCARGQGELDRAQAVRAFSLSSDIFTALGLIIGGTGGAMYWLDQRSISSPSPSKSSVQVEASSKGGRLSNVVRF